MKENAVNNALRELAEAHWAIYKAKIAAAEAGLPISTHDAGESLAIASNPRRYLVTYPVQLSIKQKGERNG